MFDTKTTKALKYYVYALIDPLTHEVFYIGKGKDNRVFDHADAAIKNENDTSDKLERIRGIKAAGKSVEHIIVRHNLTEEQALRIESVLIDFMLFMQGKELQSNLTNIVLGHNSEIYGLATANEIKRRYNAEPIEELHHNVIIININRTYDRGKGLVSIYDATRSSWVIAESRTHTLEYALAEYRGNVVGVFKIDKDSWKCVGDKKKRWEFDGAEAEDRIKDMYLNKSVPKIMGAANPIRYASPDNPLPRAQK